MQIESDTISFSDNGKQVMIHQYSKFVNLLLPHYFRHNNWRSFIRQMNMYGFKKLNRGIQNYIFINELFQRDNFEEYHLIKRRHSLKEQPSQQDPNQMEWLIDSLQNSYGSPSIGNLMVSLKQFQLEAENSLQQIKNLVQETQISNKAQCFKSFLFRVKESTQLINEYSRKMFNNIHKQIEESKQSQNFSQTKFEFFGTDIDFIKKREQNGFFSKKEQKIFQTGSLIIPQPISISQIHEIASPSIQLENLKNKQLENLKNKQMEQKKRNTGRQAPSEENQLKISRLCSFNSFTHLIDL